MEDVAQILIQPQPWCDEATIALAAAMRGDPLTTVDTLRELVTNDQAVLFAVSERGALVGYYVLAVQRKELGVEGIVIAGAGSLAGKRLIDLCLPAIEAQFIDCRTVRIHSSRPGMARVLARHGYAPAETVYRKVLHVPAAH